MKNDLNQSKVPFISKLAYGMGDVGCNFSWMFVGNFLMIFYTDVFGISMSAVATLMLFSRFWDAINDPIIGGLSDKTHTRWGRYRPWLLFAAPLTALVLILTFWAHPDWSQTHKIIYMAVTYCILVLGYTCVNIPYGTLCGAMTQNMTERAQINTSRSVSAMIAIGIINIITIPLIEWLGNGNARQGYLLIAILYGTIFAVCHIFCFAKTKEVVEVPVAQKIPLRLQLQPLLRTNLICWRCWDRCCLDLSFTGGTPIYSIILPMWRMMLYCSPIILWPSSSHPSLEQPAFRRYFN